MSNLEIVNDEFVRFRDESSFAVNGEWKVICDKAVGLVLAV